MTSLFKIYVGLNDKDTGKQEIGTDYAAVLLSQLVSKSFEGFTIIGAEGYWNKDSECTLLIEIVSKPANEYKVINLCKQMKRALNQKAVLYTRQEIITHLV